MAAIFRFVDSARSNAGHAQKNISGDRQSGNYPNLQMESTTFRARIMNYNQLAGKATMYFEWQTDFERWVKISCIAMSLFIVILYTFFM